MKDDDGKRFLLEVNRLNGAIEEVQTRLHDMDGALRHTIRRLYTVVILSAVGFATLFGCIAAFFLASLF